MIKRWIGDRTISPKVRDEQIKQIMAEAVAEAINRSDIKSTDRVNVAILTRKKRNRAKDAVLDDFIIQVTVTVI